MARLNLNVDGQLKSDQDCNNMVNISTYINNTFSLSTGCISGIYNSIGLYDVFISGKTLQCRALDHSTDAGFGVRTTGGYAIGDLVLCASTRQETYIIGGIPSDYGSGSIHRMLSYASDIATQKDKTARGLLMRGPGSDYTNEKKYTDIDLHLTMEDLAPSTSFMACSPSGITLFVDALSAGLYADAATGLWLYSDDSFARLAGVNFQRISGGEYQERYIDNTECTEYSGHSFYSWEPLGITKLNDRILKNNKEAYKQENEGGTFEPLDMLAKPFHRVMEYGGYLGHGFQRMVVAPPKNTELLKYGEQADGQYCLSRFSQFADGFIGIESLKGIHIAKKCYIPLIQQIYPIDDFTKGKGDSSEDYDFEHKDISIKDGPEFQTESTNEIYQELMALTDYYTYLENYKTIHAFAHHKKDYYIAEESEAPFIKPDYSACFSKLKNQQFAESPKNEEIDIHKQLKAKYYASESGLSFMPEGGVSFYAGFGEEIRMGAGSSVFSAPGDIWIKAGRNIHLWAGNDIILRAKQCIEESASEGSVRIKAEKNLELLGGNEGRDTGVLIESKGTGNFDFNEDGDKTRIGGIMLRTENGPTVVEGASVYVRSSCSEGGKSGSITLDSGDTSGYVYTFGNGVKHFVKTDYTIAGGQFDDPESGSVNSVVYIQPGSSSPGNITMDANVINKGQLINKGAIQVDSSIMITGTYVSTIQSRYVSPLPEEAGEEFKEALEAMFENYDVLLGTMNTMYTAFVAEFYTDGKAGNKEVLKNVCFTYRTDDEYNLNDFKIYADRWQNIAEYADASTDTWKEKEVKTKSEKGKYPFPGDKYFQGENCLVFQPLTLYNQENNTCEDRKSGEEISGIYKDPKYKKPEIKSLNDYTIIGK